MGGKFRIWGLGFGGVGGGFWVWGPHSLRSSSNIDFGMDTSFLDLAQWSSAATRSTWTHVLCSVSEGSMVVREVQGVGAEAIPSLL